MRVEQIAGEFPAGEGIPEFLRIVVAVRNSETIWSASSEISGLLIFTSAFAACSIAPGLSRFACLLDLPIVESYLRLEDFPFGCGQLESRSALQLLRRTLPHRGRSGCTPEGRPSR